MEIKAIKMWKSVNYDSHNYTKTSPKVQTKLTPLRNKFNNS